MDPVEATMKVISDHLAKLDAELHLAKKIPLRNKAGDIVAHAVVDDEDYDEFVARRWNLSDKGHAQRDGRSMHGRIMGEAPEGMVIDHWNGCSLDNRRSNLRFATRSVNSHNAPRDRSKAASQFTGVHRKNGFWMVRFGDAYVARYDDELFAAWHFHACVHEKYGASGRYNMIPKPEGWSMSHNLLKVKAFRGVTKSGDKFRATHPWVNLGTFDTAEKHLSRMRRLTLDGRKTELVSMPPRRSRAT